MKKNLLLLSMLLITGLLLFPVTGSAQWGPCYGGGWTYCPNCGSQMGYQGGYGYGCGQGMQGGMMGRGQGGMMDGPQQYRQQQNPLSEKDARALVEGNLHASRNPNLKVGGVKDVGNACKL